MANTDFVKKKKKPVSKLNLMILSIAASIVLWVVIVQTVNPDISHIITDVPVKIIGEGTLRDRGIVIIGTEDIPRFSVKISGKRNEVIQALDRIRVNFDVSQVTQLGEFAVTPTVYAPQSINVEHQNLGDIMLHFEECSAKEIPVVTAYEDLPKNKVIEIIPSVDKVSVSGAVSEMSALSKGVITIDASDISGSAKNMYKLTFCDENGKVLASQETLFCNISEVEAECILYDKVDFPVEVVMPEEMHGKYKIDFDKESIPFETVEGAFREPKDSIPSVRYVIANDDYESGRMEFTATVETDDNIFISKKNITVSGNVIKLKTKKVKLNIQVVNKPDNMNVVYTQYIAKDIVMPEDFNETDLVAYVDLLGQIPGEHMLPITFENPDLYAKDATIPVKLEVIGG